MYMEAFRESILILISTPIYVIVIGLEFFFSFFHNHNKYSAKGTITNVYLMLCNMGLDILFRGVSLFFLTYFYQINILKIEHVFLYWILLLVLEDFMFYLLHLADHNIRLFWAVHVTHHSSNEFNLTVGFRSSVFQPLYRFIYFIPLALLGFEPLDIIFMYSATQIYGILIHTQYVGKLGILDHIIATPSNHRVHHGANPQYLDRNMGMVFIFWDKLFGTFEEESEPVEFGLTTKLDSHHPSKVILHEFKQMIEDVKTAPDFRSAIMYILGPPGWSHDGSRKTSSQMRSYIKGELNNSK